MSPTLDVTDVRDPETTITYGEAVAALGRLSAELAHRADAWNGNAPGWFPAPTEWLDLFNEGLKGETPSTLDTDDVLAALTEPDGVRVMTDCAIASDVLGLDDNDPAVVAAIEQLAKDGKVQRGLVGGTPVVSRVLPPAS